MAPQSPPVSAGWPPTAHELAGQLSCVHWALEELAYDLPAGRVTRQQLDTVAGALDVLAARLRAHALDPPPELGQVDR